jgi:hypothetical protein
MQSNLNSSKNKSARKPIINNINHNPNQEMLDRIKLNQSQTIRTLTPSRRTKSAVKVKN